MMASDAYALATMALAVKQGSAASADKRACQLLLGGGNNGTYGASGDITGVTSSLCSPVLDNFVPFDAGVVSARAEK